MEPVFIVMEPVAIVTEPLMFNDPVMVWFPTKVFDPVVANTVDTVLLNNCAFCANEAVVIDPLNDPVLICAELVTQPGYCAELDTTPGDSNEPVSRPVTVDAETEPPITDNEPVIVADPVYGNGATLAVVNTRPEVSITNTLF
jgi:hypothetical protein